ncbi:MAG: cytochrome c-type biogenesis protein CcmH [Bryobacteraceae bacterium]
MRRRGVSVLLFVLATAGSLWADLANGDPRKEVLFGSFISPCCWRENLLVHHSPKADELRAEIERRIAAGESDGDIKAALIRTYSTRILSLPEGTPRIWLSWGPVAAILLGLLSVGFFIRRSLVKGPRPEAAPASLPDVPDSEWA